MDITGSLVELYGEQFLGLNFHMLRHMEEMVDNWGPLWAYTLFPFKNKNGWIRRHCHSKTSVVRAAMSQLLASQVLRVKESEIALQQEVRVLNVIRDRR